MTYSAAERIQNTAPGAYPGKAAVMSDRIEPGRPKAQDVQTNESPDDGIMEDDLTEEREVTPAEREDVAEDQKMDP